MQNKKYHLITNKTKILRADEHQHKKSSRDSFIRYGLDDNNTIADRYLLDFGHSCTA